MKTCLNPSCRARFRPRPNVPNQQVCGKAECRRWYKGHWSASAGPPRAISPAHWKRIEARLSGVETWLRCIVWVARETGLRLSELLGLEVRDVIDGRKVKKTIAVRGQWKATGFALPKTGASRVGYLTTKAREAIAEHASSRPWIHEAARLFPFSRGYVWKRWVEFQRAIGVEPEEGGHYRFHDLRHTVATDLARKGRLDLAQKVLGHKRPSSTARYNSPTHEETLEEIEKTKGDPQ